MYRYLSEHTVSNVTIVAINNTINQYAVSGDASSAAGGDNNHHQQGNWGGTVSSGDAANVANTVSYVVVRN
jgi:hypothetical protein